MDDGCIQNWLNKIQIIEKRKECGGDGVVGKSQR